MPTNTMGKILITLMLLVGIALGGLTYRYSQASILTLIVEANHDDLPTPLTWMAFKALRHLHPSQQDIAQLNQEAGARYLASLTDKTVARTLLSQYLAHGLDINSQDQQTGSGLTALQSAAIANRPQEVALLLSMGADPLIRDSKGRTALMLVQISQQNRSELDYSDVIEQLPPQ